MFWGVKVGAGNHYIRAGYVREVFPSKYNVFFVEGRAGVVENDCEEAINQGLHFAIFRITGHPLLCGPKVNSPTGARVGFPRLIIGSIGHVSTILISDMEIF